MPSKNHSLRKIGEQLKAQRRPCCICHQPIDYSLPHDHPEAFTIEHRFPRSTHPHLESDPANCDAAHASCNKRRGTTPYEKTAWVTAEEW